jgi:nitroreductase
MNDTLHLLETRRSVAPVALSGPGPTPSELDTLLRIGARVPDHGKLTPWRFIVFQGEARERAGDIVAAAFAKREPEAEATRIAAERRRMTMAPLIIGVVSRAGPHVKIPEWEQTLSAGAVCMNILIAAKAMGYAGAWLTNWFSYDRSVLSQFGVDDAERMAGFIHLGHAESIPEDRPRPALENIVTYFSGEPS